MKEFGEVITAMVTPFDVDLKVDLAVAKKLATYLVDHGSDAIVVAGTTGESPTLTAEEKLSLFAAVKEEVGNRATVIAGTGANSTATSVTLSKQAEKTGVDAIMLVGPYYNRPSQEGLYQHFRTVAESVSLPVMLYNVPSRTGRNINPDTVARLAAIENVVAIKEAAGDMDQATELRRQTPADFMIYCGDDSLTLPMMALGACGIVSVASHIAGKEIGEMVKAYGGGQTTKALELHLRLFPLFKVLFITANPVPVKKALQLCGHQVGGVRLPLVEANDGEIQQIRNVLISLGIARG
ncbi:MAG: 4-hydroxy-tetrahydrodipicolinate synthase [Bacillota bacterium]